MLLSLIFYISWLLLLLGIFILSREILISKFFKNPAEKYENYAIFGAFLITVVFMFEAILMLEEHKWRDDTIQNKLQNWIFGTEPSAHWKWHVNPITVPFSLLGRITVLFASVFGDSCGKFVANFFHQLPFSTAIFAIPFTFICIFIGIFCIFGYQFNIGYGFLKIEKSQGISKIPAFFKRISGKENEKMDKEKEKISKLEFCVKKVNEGYQKAIGRRI